MTDAPLRRLQDLPGIDDLELKALMKPRLADPDLRHDHPEVDTATLAAFGDAFNDARYLHVVWLILPVIGLLERAGLQERARMAIGGIRAATARGDELTVDWDTNEVRNLRSGQTLMLQPFSASERGMLDAGGLIPYLKRRVAPAS